MKKELLRNIDDLQIVPVVTKRLGKYLIKVSLRIPHENALAEIRHTTRQRLMQAIGGVLLDGKYYSCRDIPDLIASELDTTESREHRALYGIHFPKKIGIDPALHAPTVLIPWWCYTPLHRAFYGLVYLQIWELGDESNDVQ